MPTNSSRPRPGATTGYREWAVLDTAARILASSIDPGCHHFTYEPVGCGEECLDDLALGLIDLASLLAERRQRLDVFFSDRSILIVADSKQKQQPVRDPSEDTRYGVEQCRNGS